MRALFWREFKAISACAFRVLLTLVDLGAVASLFTLDALSHLLCDELLLAFDRAYAAARWVTCLTHGGMVILLDVKSSLQILMSWQYVWIRLLCIS